VASCRNRAIVYTILCTAVCAVQFKLRRHQTALLLRDDVEVWILKAGVVSTFHHLHDYSHDLTTNIGEQPTILALYSSC